jgi:hypothetical protein
MVRLKEALHASIITGPVGQKSFNTSGKTSALEEALKFGQAYRSESLKIARLSRAASTVCRLRQLLKAADWTAFGEVCLPPHTNHDIRTTPTPTVGLSRMNSVGTQVLHGIEDQDHDLFEVEFGSQDISISSLAQLNRIQPRLNTTFKIRRPLPRRIFQHFSFSRVVSSHSRRLCHWMSWQRLRR